MRPAGMRTHRVVRHLLRPARSRTYSALVMSDPFLHYQSLVNVQHFRKDESQLRAAKELQKLYRRIDGYTPPVDFARKIKQVEKLLRNRGSDNPVRKYLTGSSDKSLVKQLSWEEELLNIDSPRGLMLSGSVGSGKSMLIDTLLPMKKRWHYNAFMLELFDRLNRARDDEYILLKIAYELIEESPILAIDEFQLGDPASARILKGVLIYFWKMGGVLVATSNRMPEDLYSGSFQADQFKSFTELLGTRCVIHDMRSTRDFRTEIADQLTYYNAPTHESTIMDDTIAKLLPDPTETQLLVFSRKLRIPTQSETTSTALFDFQYICAQDLGSADYISIAARYATIIIDHVPILTLQKKNEARRFISLIDALYESKCRLLIRADATPDALFFPDSDSEVTGSIDSIASEAFSETYYDVTEPNRPNVSSYLSQSTDLGHDAARDERDARLMSSSAAREKQEGRGTHQQDFGRLNAFIGQDEQFAFRRAASRIYEMTSAVWWSKVTHDPSIVFHRPWEHQRTSRIPRDLDTIEHETSEAGVVGGGSPFRKFPEPPPRFNWTHFFGMMRRGGERKKTNQEDWRK